MKKDDKMKALEIINDNGGTVDTMPTLNGFVKHEYLALLEAPHITIKKLIEAGYHVSVHQTYGHPSNLLLLDKY